MTGASPRTHATVVLRPHRIHHANRVGRMTVRIGRTLGLAPSFLEDLEEAVPFHDIGKLTIPSWILDKPGSLTDYERVLMQTHTLAGARLLRATGEPTLELAAEIAESHHERWDGSGYPNGVAEEEIPLGARIVAIADVFDALVHVRPYKPAWPRQAAIDEIVTSAGSQFDPRIVEAFVACVRRGPRARDPRRVATRVPSRTRRRSALERAGR
jgi:putative two-component system response regulator